MFRSTLRARAAALALGVLTIAGSLTACQSQFGDLKLVIATGTTDGVYYQLGSELAGIWAGQLGIAKPTVVPTQGSVQNIQQLDDGTADIGFGSADAIDPKAGPGKLRALARIYDDYIQVVVRADEPIADLAELSGHRVAVGQGGSQVQLVAGRIIKTAGVRGIIPEDLDLNESIAAMRNGSIDAFFWSGGLPTQSITQLAESTPVRLLDLGKDPSGVVTAMIKQYLVYGEAPVAAGTYGAVNLPVTTLTVPNFLLVTDRMPDNVAEALVRGLFDATGKLAGVNAAALGIDVHSAIYTQPVPLANGAQEYYRAAKQ